MDNPVTWGQLSITGLVGGVIGSFITHLFASWRDSRKEFRDASRRLRDAFTPELGEMDPLRMDKDVDVRTLLNNTLPKQRAAVAEFSFYLSDKKREGFENEFQRYIQGIYEGDYERNLTHTYNTPEGTLTKTGSYALFQQRIRAVIRYAEHRPWYKRF
jgi:hypothetical protein